MPLTRELHYVTE